MSRRALRLDPPPDRGPLLTPEEVAALIGGVSPAWVRRHVEGKVALGQKTVRYYQHDVRAWISNRPSHIEPKPRHSCEEPGCHDTAAASRHYCVEHHKQHATKESAA